MLQQLGISSHGQLCRVLFDACGPAVPARPHRCAVLQMDVGPLAPTSRADDDASSSDHRPGPQGDVHALAGHPRVEGRPYDAGGGGATRSRDGRFTWDAAGTGWDCPCVLALVLDPTAPDRWFVPGARGARRGHGDGPARAAVWRWSAEGPWGPLSAGLPDPQDSISYAAGSHVFAGIADGRIHRTPDRGDTRERLSAQADAVVAVDEGG